MWLPWVRPLGVPWLPTTLRLCKAFVGSAGGLVVVSGGLGMSGKALLSGAASEQLRVLPPLVGPLMLRVPALTGGMVRGEKQMREAGRCGASP